MLKVRNVGLFGRKLEKCKPSSAFSHQFLYCYAPEIYHNIKSHILENGLYNYSFTYILYNDYDDIDDQLNRDYFMESACVRDFHTSW